VTYFTQDSSGHPPPGQKGGRGGEGQVRPQGGEARAAFGLDGLADGLDGVRGIVAGGPRRGREWNGRKFYGFASLTFLGLPAIPLSAAISV
jgi:hypothetical protein